MPPGQKKVKKYATKALRSVSGRAHKLIANKEPLEIALF
jgi:hypothetical protein